MWRQNYYEPSFQPQGHTKDVDEKTTLYGKKNVKHVQLNLVIVIALIVENLSLLDKSCSKYIVQNLGVHNGYSRYQNLYFEGHFFSQIQQY